MSDAGDRLARTRLAIIDQVQRRERRSAGRGKEGERGHARAQGEREGPEGEDEEPGAGWFGHVKRALGTWWRHHPAHMGVELATPLLSAYAQRKPLQFLGIAAAVGAVVMVARPWRLISATGIVVALVKSSQLSSLIMSALSAADFQKDHRPYE
jgi:hypothetical protein